MTDEITRRWIVKINQIKTPKKLKLCKSVHFVLFRVFLLLLFGLSQVRLLKTRPDYLNRPVRHSDTHNVQFEYLYYSVCSSPLFQINFFLFFLKNQTAAEKRRDERIRISARSFSLLTDDDGSFRLDVVLPSG